MDVRAKQRLSYISCLFSLNLCGGGFAARHLNRWTANHMTQTNEVGRLTAMGFAPFGEWAAQDAQLVLKLTACANARRLLYRVTSLLGGYPIINQV
ncbi:hypothetical protein BH18ACI3_BH18ACI3_15360 [soil metagenome]